MSEKPPRITRSMLEGEHRPNMLLSSFVNGALVEYTAKPLSQPTRMHVQETSTNMFQCRGSIPYPEPREVDFSYSKSGSLATVNLDNSGQSVRGYVSPDPGDKFSRPVYIHTPEEAIPDRPTEVLVGSADNTSQTVLTHGHHGWTFHELDLEQGEIWATAVDRPTFVYKSYGQAETIKGSGEIRTDKLDELRYLDMTGDYLIPLDHPHGQVMVDINNNGLTQEIDVNGLPVVLHIMQSGSVPYLLLEHPNDLWFCNTGLENRPHPNLTRWRKYHNSQEFSRDPDLIARSEGFVSAPSGVHAIHDDVHANVEAFNYQLESSNKHPYYNPDRPAIHRPAVKSILVTTDPLKQPMMEIVIGSGYYMAPTPFHGDFKHNVYVLHTNKVQALLEM